GKAMRFTASIDPICNANARILIQAAARPITGLPNAQFGTGGASGSARATPSPLACPRTARRPLVKRAPSPQVSHEQLSATLHGRQAHVCRLRPDARADGLHRRGVGLVAVHPR